MKKRRKIRPYHIKLELQATTQREGTISFMSKSIAQDMAYRQSLMKCAEMHGVKLSGWRYNKSRSYLCFWKARWDETVGSQSCRFRRPTVMSQQKFRFTLRGSAVSAEEGWAFTAKSTWASPGTTLRWAQGRTASPGPHRAGGKDRHGKKRRLDKCPSAASCHVRRSRDCRQAPKLLS